MGFLKIFTDLHDIRILYGPYFSRIFHCFFELFGKLYWGSIGPHDIHLCLNNPRCLAVWAYYFHIETTPGSSENMDILFRRLRTALLASKVCEGRFDDIFNDEVVHSRIVG